MSRRSPPPLLVALAAVWVALPVLAPLCAARGSSGLAFVLYAFFHPVCHQLPARSFFLLGHPLAVCHRCMGLYSGLLAGLLLLPHLHRLRTRLEARTRDIAWFAVPMLIDVALPLNTAGSRFATGALAGFPVALVLWLAWEQIASKASRISRTTTPAEEGA